MADTLPEDLTATTTLDPADILVAFRDIAGTPVDRHITVDDFASVLAAMAGMTDVFVPKSLAVAEGDIFYATAADTIVRLPKGTAGQVLTMNAGASAPEWAEPTGGGGSVTDPIQATGDSSGLTTATTLYTAGDQLGNIIELTNMAASAGGYGVIGTLGLLADVHNVIGAVRAWIFSETVTLAADNAAFSLSDADAAKLIGTVILPSPATAANNAKSVVPNLNLDYKCTATSLFVALETLSTHTQHFAAVDDLHITANAYRF